uniref:Bcl-2-like protein 2 n=3 Tax=Artiodactyla TaxID=91561 RepID=A0A4W2GUJ7_BOBOX
MGTVLFSGHPLQGWKSSTSAWNVRDLLEMLNLLQGFMRPSRLLFTASRVRSPAWPLMPSWPCSSWPPAALFFPELWLFPSLRPSPAPLSGRISGPHHHPAPGPPSRPPFLLPPSFPPFLPVSLPPSSCTRKQPDPGSGLTPARMATPASAPDTRALVADFVGYKLRQKGYVCGAGPGEGPAADPLHQAMRAAGDEFETRFRRTFSDLAAQLHVTPGSAQQRFTQVSDELFQGGPNWGRLVAFFVFGAALCAESVNKEMEPLVGQVQEWMVAYLETRLADWIHSSGGWAEFTALYGDGALEEARRLREGNWASVRTVLTGAVALGALVTVGAFFASK